MKSNFSILIITRMYRFCAYPVTQYYILQRKIRHECLESEGGVGITCVIEKGIKLFARKHWRLVEVYLY